MKKLLVLVVLGVAAWQGYKHYPELLHRTPSHEAVIVNATGHVIERLRITIDSRTVVKEVLENRESTAFPFRVNHDSPFQLLWEYRDTMGEHRWQGGLVARGPLVQRHVITIEPDGGAIYNVHELSESP